VCAEEHERLDAIEKTIRSASEEDRSGIRARSECRALDDEQPAARRDHAARERRRVKAIGSAIA